MAYAMPCALLQAWFSRQLSKDPLQDALGPVKQSPFSSRFEVPTLDKFPASQPVLDISFKDACSTGALEVVGALPKFLSYGYSKMFQYYKA